MLVFEKILEIQIKNDFDIYQSHKEMINTPMTGYDSLYELYLEIVNDYLKWVGDLNESVSKKA